MSLFKTKKKNFREYWRFVVTGISNTAVDFSVLNTLLFFAGQPLGKTAYILFKGISFCAAVTNSYFLNKHWVFPHAADRKEHKEKILFLGVSLLGFIINVTSSLFVFTMVQVLVPDINKVLGANIGAIFGAVLTKMWNFLSYKFIVFKDSSDMPKGEPLDHPAQSKP